MNEMSSLLERADKYLQSASQFVENVRQYCCATDNLMETVIPNPDRVRNLFA